MIHLLFPGFDILIPPTSDNFISHTHQVPIDASLACSNIQHIYQWPISKLSACFFNAFKTHACAVFKQCTGKTPGSFLSSFASSPGLPQLECFTQHPSFSGAGYRDLNCFIQHSSVLQACQFSSFFVLQYRCLSVRTAM